MPDLTAIIPSQGRASLGRAVASVLSQAGADVEVIVVVDGERYEAAAMDHLASLPGMDGRVHVKVLAEAKGGGAARNAGVEAAHSPLVGFLDDDDEWLPGKAARVVAKSYEAGTTDFILSHSYCRMNGTGGQSVLPRLPPPTRASDLAKYLLSRNRLRYGANSLQTSTLVTTRTKALDSPWPVVGRHQDWAWLLECVGLPTRLIHLEEALTRVHVDDVQSVSRLRTNPERSREFLARFADRIPRRAATDFLITEVLRRTPVTGWPEAISSASTQGAELGVPHLAAVALAIAGRMGSRGKEPTLVKPARRWLNLGMSSPRP